MPIVRRLSLALAAALAMLVVAPARADDVARVTNVATLSFGGPDARVQVRSNAVTLDVDRTKHPTTLGFRLLPPGYALSGERCETTPALRYTPAPIDADTLSRAAPVAALDRRTPVILVLDNPGSNRDPAVREGATIHMTTDGYDGPVTLLETGPDTGSFAGGVSLGGNDPAAVACDVALERGGRMRLSFTEDPYSFGSVAEMLIDPAGEIFDSVTGTPVDGAQVTLLDEGGHPATVFGDDGVSRYPATVTSGGTVRDASGRTYVQPPGRYRFPLVAPGRYHLHVEPPAGYTAPSTRSPNDLATLRNPGGRAFVINDASFGGTFVLSKPDPFYADVPVDRAGPFALLLTKTASVREASPGDIVQYRVTLANRTAVDARNVRVTDLLPLGLRYQPGSTRGADEPRVAADGRTLLCDAYDDPGGGLSRLVALLRRLDDAPHVLLWSAREADAPSARPSAPTAAVDLVELPRLRLSFRAVRRAANANANAAPSGAVELESVEHPGHVLCRCECDRRQQTRLYCCC